MVLANEPGKFQCENCDCYFETEQGYDKDVGRIPAWGPIIKCPQCKHLWCEWLNYETLNSQYFKN